MVAAVTCDELVVREAAEAEQPGAQRRDQAIGDRGRDSR